MSRANKRATKLLVTIKCPVTRRCPHAGPCWRAGLTGHHAAVCGHYRPYDGEVGRRTTATGNISRPAYDDAQYTLEARWRSQAASNLICWSASTVTPRPHCRQISQSDDPVTPYLVALIPVEWSEVSGTDRLRATTAAAKTLGAGSLCGSIHWQKVPIEWRVKSTLCSLHPLRLRSADIRLPSATNGVTTYKLINLVPKKSLLKRQILVVLIIPRPIFIES